MNYIEPVPNVPSLSPVNIYEEEIQPLNVQVDKVYTDTANVVNDKARREQYLLQEDITADTWPNENQNEIPLQVFRKTLETGVLTAGIANIIPHGIVTIDRLIDIRVMVTNGTTRRFIPYASPILANNASVDVTSTNVTITLGATFGAGYSGYIIMQYTKL